MTKSANWLKMTRPEQHAHRAAVIALLARLAPDLERFNRGAAEAAFMAAGRMQLINDMLASVIANEEAARLRAA